VTLIYCSSDLEITRGKGEVIVHLNPHSKLCVGTSLNVLDDGVWVPEIIFHIVVLLKWLVIDEDLNVESRTRTRSNHIDGIELFVKLDVEKRMGRQLTDDGNGPFISRFTVHCMK
jgi:hypothetical protein